MLRSLGESSAHVNDDLESQFLGLQADHGRGLQGGRGRPAEVAEHLETLFYAMREDHGPGVRGCGEVLATLTDKLVSEFRIYFCDQRDEEKGETVAGSSKSAEESSRKVGDERQVREGAMEPYSS